MSDSSDRSAWTAAVARQHGAMEFTTAPVDLDAVRRYRLSRLRSEMKHSDVAGLVLFDQINTRYATDATKQPGTGDQGQGTGGGNALKNQGMPGPTIVPNTGTNQQYIQPGTGGQTSKCAPGATNCKP